METDSSFTIIGEPVPKGRPKFAVRGGYAIVYTPKKTRNNEKDLRAQMLPYRPEKPLTSPVSLTFEFYFSPPKSLRKWEKELVKAEKLPKVSRPDLDNLAKQLTDAMMGIFFADDNLIYKISASKWYSDRPRIQVSISEMKE